MSRLRTSSSVVSFAFNVRTEDMDVRAVSRTFGKSHTMIMPWEQCLSSKIDEWSPSVPEGSDVTIEGDEVYTRIRENLPTQ